MVLLFTALLSVAAPVRNGPALHTACCQKSGVRTSSQALQFAPQRPSDDEKEKNRIRIGITVQQQQQIDALWTDTGAKIREVREAQQQKNLELRQVMEKYDFDRGKARALREQIIQLHRKAGDIHAENEEKLRKILTRDQFERLQGLMKEMFEKRRKEWQDHHPKGPGGAPGGPGGGPPPEGRSTL